MKRAMVFGKNAIAIECTKILLATDGVELVGVCPNNNDTGKDGWQRSFARFCHEQNIEIFRFENIRDKDSINELRGLDLDLIFSFQYDQIISQELLDIMAGGAINIHFSPLPRYRGVSPVAWALINGETRHGVTMHYIDAGIDTGDIIAQAEFEIDGCENAKELYLKCESAGVELFKINVDAVVSDTNLRNPQNNRKASYYAAGSIEFTDCKIMFNATTYMLYNWIRAFIFPPFQYPSFEFDGNLQKVVKAKPIYDSNKFERAGSLVSQENKKFIFSTMDAYIELEVE